MRKDKRKDKKTEKLNENSPYDIFTANGKPKTKGWSLASMIMGVLSVALCLFGWMGVAFGVAAIILSLVARRGLGYFDGMTIAGLITGIFGLVFGGAMLYLIYFDPEFLHEFKEYFRQQYNQ